ncbi:Bax inhibitor-1/YccA family protein [Flammeovirga aprica]|uniref:Bax inhibitor-1/YccA family protein n=1 Tax=Flammeovirga aprica JL-4 TaxID=694437 RepID=A0A7X9P159_9BACT|nr:Bax inhibitor-1/YccA family protein [Flammeovirga aprica]NME67641.1 Bax inhibitor-1/YccA family protein [Flammeovirga aprica JL-4]
MRQQQDYAFQRSQRSIDDIAGIQNSFMTKVYGWMSAGLVITALVAMFVANNASNMALVANNYWILIIAQFGLVIFLSARIHKMSAVTATTLFILYSALTGVTLSSIFYVYPLANIGSTFLITAGTFIGMSIFGLTTKRDLTSMGNLLYMALLGLILTSVVNIFLGSSLVYWISSAVGVLIFVGLIAFDSQKLRDMGYQIADGESAQKMAIHGALSLYLDFINLFLLLLRFFGGSRD